MAARHDTPEYRDSRKKWGRVVAYGGAECMQTAPGDPRPGSGCIMTDRYIQPGARWDLAHDESGTVILGPAHAKCNRTDGGRRRHLKNRRTERWIL